jgi:TnpA family transposase
LQPSDTAYPRFKSRLAPTELEEFYTLSDTELQFCNSMTRSATTRLGFVLLLKTYQRLGYFVFSKEVPSAIIEHIATVVGEFYDKDSLAQYDSSQARRKHLSAVRDFLGVKPFGDDGKRLMRQAFHDAAMTKEDIIDIVNIGIETLVRYRYELPAFDTLAREARVQRVSANQALYTSIHNTLTDEGRSFIDQLFIVSNDPRRVSPWNDLKRDTAKPTIDGIRNLLARYDNLMALSGHSDILKTIPVIKSKQWALEGNSLDAASMVDMTAAKRYAVALALIRHRLAIVTDDLCDIFCKQMRKIEHTAQDALEKYLKDNQEMTDEILRRFAFLETVLSSGQPENEQLQSVRHAVTNRPDLCEFSRLHAEYGGKNPFRFIRHYFKPKRSALLRILSKLSWVSTSQDNGFERSLAFVLGNRSRHKEWFDFNFNSKTKLTPNDLAWIPERWWQLVTGESQRNTVATRINYRQFEACVCLQMVQELKSGDICVVGSDAYSDHRDELVPMDECERTRYEYSEEVGLPLETDAFINHVRALLANAAEQLDSTYQDNPYFKIINGRPKLLRQEKKPVPPGFKQLDEALTRKLDKLELSLLDVLADTLQWLGWGKSFAPLSGHKSKLQEEDRRKILTVFAYGTGIGPTQIAKNIADISARQVSFVNQRQVTTEKLESAITMAINAYNKFELPGYWGDTKRVAADGTQWNLYENNLLSERHIRYGGYGGIAYYHVSDNYIALFSHFIPCGVWEAVYILDGLTKNKSDIQPDTVHGDTQAQSAPVYGLAFLLGIKLMPRIRNWKDLKWFRPTAKTTYLHIGDLFTKDNIDWELIARHLPDMLQVAQSIRAGRISPSTILRKLGTASRKNKLYFAFRELGRVIRTISLLEYIGDHELRRIVQAAQNKCEGFNKFAQWIYFGSDTIEDNVRDNQLKIIKYNHLIANLLIFHNCHTITQALKELEAEGFQLTPEILDGLSPYRTHHTNRFGMYELRERKLEPINYGVKFDLA